MWICWDVFGVVFEVFLLWCEGFLEFVLYVCVWVGLGVVVDDLMDV